MHALKNVPVQEPSPPEGVVASRRRLAFSEYAHGAGVQNLGLETRCPRPPSSDEAQRHPRPVPALSGAVFQPALNRSARPPCRLACSDKASREVAAVACRPSPLPDQP